MTEHCDCGNPSVKYYGPHEPDCAWWEEYVEVEQGVELGYLCAMDGQPCEVEDCQERYGDDADGNRGIWVYYKRCRKCGEES